MAYLHEDEQTVPALAEIANFLDSSAASRAMAQLQTEMAGEAERGGIEGEDDVQTLVDEGRKEAT